jgi:hypothetical protein
MRNQATIMQDELTEFIGRRRLRRSKDESNLPESYQHLDIPVLMSVICCDKFAKIL